MEIPNNVLAVYLSTPGPHKLEIGAGRNAKPGWLATDLKGDSSSAETPVIALDATEDFPIPSDSFDYVYAEHMIEHISFDDARNMLFESNRILKPGGVIRIVTPSLGFLLRIISPDRGALEDRYIEWSVRTFAPEAPNVTNAFFLNSFVRNWGHKFIYDRETLALAMQAAGFDQVRVCRFNSSNHAALTGLENADRMPPGFLELESMVLEGTKVYRSVDAGPVGDNLSYGKRATQSSVSQWSRGATVDEDASRVVSGIQTGSYNCHTSLEDRPWWRVDLAQICNINEIRITNRIAAPQIAQRTSRFEIQISNDDKTWETVFRKDDGSLVRGACSKRSPFIWVPQQAFQARYVRIQLLGRDFLHLEQVEIYGYAL